MSASQLVCPVDTQTREPCGLMNIPILFEDDRLMIVNKPSGLLTIPAPRRVRASAQHEPRTLAGILSDDARQKGCAYRLHPCHRLDRETSGVIIFAKGKTAQKKMMAQFHTRDVEKRYLAFVHGHLRDARGKIAVPLEGREALTTYRLLAEYRDFSMVEAVPVTGRSNQIRLHFKAIGHPLVGESRFAFRKEYALKAKRAMLHAQSVVFTHPQTRTKIKVEASMPGDMRRFLALHT